MLFKVEFVVKIMHLLHDDDWFTIKVLFLLLRRQVHVELILKHLLLGVLVTFLLVNAGELPLEG